MSRQAQATAVRAEVVVETPIAQAFTVFTEGIGSWFPKEYDILPVDIAERVFEPRVGGHIYDRGTDGSECHWARVLAYEPPTRVVIGWDINPRWQIETDPEKTSEVELRFISEAPDRTR
ncbi:MAG: SRPBCC domain-containing protein, partial [Vicinamibacteraceae bacterium]